MFVFYLRLLSLLSRHDTIRQDVCASEFARLAGERGGRTKGRRQKREGMLKASRSHKVTLKASLITSAFHLPPSHEREYVRIQRSEESGLERGNRKMRRREGLWFQNTFQWKCAQVCLNISGVCVFNLVCNKQCFCPVFSLLLSLFLPRPLSLCLWSMLGQHWLLNKSMLGLGGHGANRLRAGMRSAGSPHASQITQLPRVHSTEWNHEHKIHLRLVLLSFFVVIIWLPKSHSLPHPCSPILHPRPKQTRSLCRLARRQSPQP